MSNHSITLKPLTARQKAFGRAFIELNNATQAAIKAGYSSKIAATQGCLLLQHPGVKRYVNQLRAIETERARDRLDAVYDQIGHCLTREGTDFINKETGEFLPVHQLPERANASIDGIEIEERFDKDGGKVVKTKLKLVSKASVMDMAVKVLGGYAPTGPSANTSVNVSIDNRKVVHVLRVRDDGRGPKRVESH